MGSTNLPPAMLKDILVDVHNIQVSRYNMLALSVLYIYDLVTTLDQEVELIWKKPKSLLSVLFFLNRYFVLCAAVCENWTKFVTGEAVVTLATIHAILIIRVWAIYQRSMRVLIPLGVFGVCCFISFSTIIVVGNIRPSNAEPVPGLFTCTFEMPSWYAATLLPILAFETTLFTLMLWRGYQVFHKSDPVVTISGTSGCSLAQVLKGLFESSSSYALFLPPVVTSKLLLNLRGEISCPDQNTTMELSTLRAAVYDPSNMAVNSELDAFTTHIDRWEEWGPNAEAPQVHGD
ncbi:hypothetical protein GYMLUDRAFT_76815 [Collybiopsis luxurians FD-317 M1]|uniref:DUF6533 domain-containing protein n=1 Tax=Collybiopsis luxurians FD-317 M1 TaxID=944289 RepID=A0A0D0BYG8_9AGAR|nr:hypothetical protein GYMLUDRAFT_76815 [Collybiopsis luxurians FD-317 M1]